VDDVVSVGRPAPSVHSDHTEYDLLQRHLKDRYQLEQDFPDGSEDGYRPKEEEERPDGTGSTECLLDIPSTPSTRGKATVLNYQAKQKTNGTTIQGVEMEAVTWSMILYCAMSKVCTYKYYYTEDCTNNKCHDRFAPRPTYCTTYSVITYVRSCFVELQVTYHLCLSQETL